MLRLHTGEVFIPPTPTESCELAECMSVDMEGLSSSVGGFVNNISDWFDLCPRAKSRKYGRLFRSPTLWEDFVSRHPS